jgi:hypothetical protein
MTFSDVGSMASIISLIFTVLVLIDVRRLRSYYLFTGRVPVLTQKLDQHQLKIEEYLNDFDKSISLIWLELAKVEVVLKSLRSEG